MTAALLALLVVPVATGLLGTLPGLRRAATPLAILGALASLVLAVLLAIDVDRGTGQPSAEIIEPWIPGIGVSFHVALDGLNAVLVAMTAFVWLLGVWWSSRDRELATPTYFFLMGLAQAAVVGAFIAQDLLLFVFFFDLMLLPFVLLLARGARADEARDTSAFLQLLVYTLVGSLLMLVAAVAMAVYSAEQAGAPVSFDIATLAATTLPPSTQKLLLVAFLAAFLIKMPIAPLHGWMPAVYRAMPLPPLTVFAAVLSKVAAYGLLKIVLPLLPDAVVSWRLLLVVLALVSIIYGSMIAFTTQEPRLILGYSSLAQLGFILLGISSLDPAGAQGAVLQSVTHALVVVPAVVIIALIVERAGGDVELRELGGIARRAPVLAALFLIVALCWLAMPGSGNFVAEYLVLLGQWRVAPWATIIASIGVVLAAYYALRLMIGAMQNARGSAVPEEAPDVHGRDRAVLGVAVAALVAVSLVPSALLKVGEASTETAVSAPRLLWESERKAAGDERAPNEVFDPGVIR